MTDRVADRRNTGRQETAEDSAGAVWAKGDLDRFAGELLWELGPVLVRACGIEPGPRVLDVAAGPGLWIAEWDIALPSPGRSRG